MKNLSHWVLNFPKMWYFLGVRLFKGELLAVKVQSFFNFFQQQNAVLQKKDTATILIFRA